MLEPEILDRITVRYEVSAQFPIKIAGQPVTIEAEFSISCGVYEGIPNNKMLAGLIADRGIFAHDLKISSEGIAAAVAAQIMQDGIRAPHIIAYTIAEVSIDDEVIAQTFPPAA